MDHGRIAHHEIQRLGAVWRSAQSSYPDMARERQDMIIRLRATNRSLGRAKDEKLVTKASTQWAEAEHIRKLRDVDSVRERASDKARGVRVRIRVEPAVGDVRSLLANDKWARLWQCARRAEMLF